jgi:ribosome-associated toxin RatA of RatAB toxin-antitoxin module
MAVIERSALLPYSAQQLFDLVNDVSSYPQYMNGCVGAEVLHQDDQRMDARLDLKKKGISQSFATRNTLQSPETITMALLDGPFEKLEGQWRFDALASNACKVTFELEFVMNSQLAGKAAGKLIESVAMDLVASVCDRAGTVYG